MPSTYSIHLVDQEEEPFVEKDSNGRYGRYDEVLGKGFMKKVYRAFDMEEGIEVAWSKVDLRNLEDDDMMKGVSIERLYSEIRLLKSLKHDNILKLYHVWLDRSTSCVNFITEVCTSGTLREYRRKHRHVSMKALKSWARHILEGLEYLHTNKPCIIHRDLNCSNIFINGNTGTLKIGDLGYAATLGSTRAAHTIIGRPQFMAPELYDEYYNELVDVYSFGMCLVELVTLEIPYSECKSITEIYKKVRSDEKPLALNKVDDKHVKALIERCLAPPTIRPSAAELLMDPFFI